MGLPYLARSFLELLLGCFLILLTLHTAPILTAIATPVNINTTASASEATVLVPPPQPPPPPPPPPPPLLKNNTVTKKVCRGINIRNNLAAFEQLRGCNIIDGPLTIALVSNQTFPYEPKDYENITFPELVEITDYLLFFRVQGLSSFEKLFPKLSVIRGRGLVENYALIIYEMMHLQKINLPSLTDILRGSVRIESNPNLCYVSTVNWRAICKNPFVQNFFKDNNARCDNRCPDYCHPWRLDSRASSDIITKPLGDIDELGAENNRSLFCWSNQACHESCYDQAGNSLLPAPDGGCCSLQCAGGCYSKDQHDQCVSCRFVSQGENCVSHCYDNFFEYKGKCINETECEMVQETFRPPGQCREFETVISNFKAIRGKHGQCQVSCPPGSEEDPTNRNKCKLCDRGKCRKVCTPGNEKPFMVTNINSLKELQGCNVIEGSLEISMKGGKNALSEMEAAFQDLEEIRGYLKITRSYPILTLDFLRNLKAINGSQLDRGLYSLVLIDNPNLQELFFHQSREGSSKIKILQGTVFAHLNPKLCPYRIKKLKEYTTIGDWDNRDVSEHTNGDKETCNQKKLDVQLFSAKANLAVIKFQNLLLGLEDPRVLLYYLINYRVAPAGNVSMFDGRDGCAAANDLWTTVEEAPRKDGQNEAYQLAYIEVKPATRYALYVKTFTISQDAGAVSDIIYFETAPDTPGHPRMVESSALGHDSVIVSWLPPAKPNGIIERYIITVSRIREYIDVQNLDICYSISDRDKITESLTNDEPKHNALIPSTTTQSSTNDVTSTNQCSKTGLSNDADLHVEQVSFQDTIIEFVYVENKCVPVEKVNSANKPVKRRRSIDQNSSSFDEAMGDNSLPRKPLSDNMKASTINDIKHPDDTNKSIARIPPNIRFDSSVAKIVANISANIIGPDSRLTATITGMDHFSRISIEIVACHGEFKSDRVTTSGYYERCGVPALTQVRTQAIPENDRVNGSSIRFTLANETTSAHMLSWRPPESPNGLVLAYKMRYREKSGDPEVWSEVCTNATIFKRDHGYRLPALKSGTYLISVQAVSLYSAQRFWSDNYEFDVPSDRLLSPLMLTLIIIISIIALVLAAISAAYFVQKRNRDDLIYASVNPDYVQYNPDEWECDKANLIVGEQIGTGSFGIVLKGQLITEKGTRECAVKTVPPSATAKQRMDFLREASTMKQFDTFHVVKLLGVISVTTPVYVIMEYMANGDLKEYLRKQRESHQKQKKTIVDGIYLMAAQIADGMAYLESKKYVHRDLAARNCMVGDNGVVKIGDFGLTRDIYQNEYYRRGTADRLPVRWMAPESLKDNIYTSASDAWSYGIVLWEIITFSSYPYQGLSNDEVIKRVINGYTMPRPENCPNNLYTILEKCWRKNEKQRPTFMSIVEFLLPNTEGKLYPNCFYRKPTNNDAGDSIAQTIPEEAVNGTESYPLLSWPSSNHRANGLVNGENHVNHASENNHGERNH